MIVDHGRFRPHRDSERYATLENLAERAQIKFMDSPDFRERVQVAVKFLEQLNSEYVSAGTVMHGDIDDVVIRGEDCEYITDAIASLRDLLLPTTAAQVSA